MTGTNFLTFYDHYMATISTILSFLISVAFRAESIMSVLSTNYSFVFYDLDVKSQNPE